MTGNADAKGEKALKARCPRHRTPDLACHEVPSPRAGRSPHARSRGPGNARTQCCSQVALSCVISCRWEAAWPLWHPRDASLACSSRSQGGEQRRVVARRVLPRGLLSPSVSERGSAPNLVHFGAVQDVSDMGLWCLHWLLHPIAVNQPAQATGVESTVAHGPVEAKTTSASMAPDAAP